MKTHKIPYFAFQKCCSCHSSLRNKNRNKNIRRITSSNVQEARMFFKKSSMEVDDYICNRCRIKFIHNKPANDMNNSKLKDLEQSISAKVFKINQNIESNVDDNNALTKSSGKIIFLPTAYSSHAHCILCDSKKNLRSVKPESIIHAYFNNGIIIHNSSRCCDEHLDSQGIIELNEIKNISTTLKPYQQNIVMTFESCLEASIKIQHNLEHNSGVFYKLKDMALLDNDFCFKITGWNKLQFMSFSRLITRVRDTCGRTKEQLIAIYKYWLSKGIDQSSLAMFKTHTSQQQISHYLDQIRSEMHEEVVPLLLGSNKGKDFFLMHNTQSVKALHNLADDVLALIADGTYTRLEKSSNNDFQYDSYSMQKQQNLIKPFLICCADGYFVDCYGPFKAHLNDAKIFRHILNTDEDLQKLLHPEEKIIIFLDRGYYLALNLY